MIEKIRKIGKKNIFFNGKMIKRTVYQDPYNGNIWIESKDGGIHMLNGLGIVMNQQDMVGVRGNVRNQIK